MSVQDIKTYIEQNKGTYPIETLVPELLKAGYGVDDVRQVIDESVPTQINPTHLKVAHFFVGLFGTWITFVVLVLIYYNLIQTRLPYLDIAFCVSAAVVYFSIRKKYPYIAKGIPWSFVVVIALACMWLFLYVPYWYSHFG